jgi:hypothetical protein
VAAPKVLGSPILHSFLEAPTDAADAAAAAVDRQQAGGAVRGTGVSAGPGM